MNHLTVVVGLSVCLSGCGIPSLFNPATNSSNFHPYTAADEDTAMKAVVTCFYKSAGQLDDGTSNATSVAIGLESSCANEWNISVSVQARNMNWQTQKLFRERMETQELQVATQIVLDERANTRKLSSQ
jgi:hypothetical protein